MEVHNPIQQNLICRTCQLTIPSQQQFKNHFKSDFHRYNIKRNQVSLKPATLQQFNNKKHHTVAAESNITFLCKECGKSFGSKNTFDQHVRSKKHDPNFVREQREIRENSQSPKKNNTPQPYKKDQLKCLFCLNKAISFEENLKHMEKSHSFFIASKQYCTNVENLILYLQQKIEVGNICIYCDNKKAKDFATGDAVRKHMIDKGHCFMKTSQGYEQYQNFYDFSAQFLEKINQQKGYIPPGIQFQEVKVLKNQTYNNRLKQKSNQKNSSVINKTQQQNKDNNDQQQWEDQESDEEDNNSQSQQQQQWQQVQEQQEDKQKQQKEKQEQTKRQKTKVKKYLIMRPTITNTDQLLLPNGKILGHRKYKLFYKQSCRTGFWQRVKQQRMIMNQMKMSRQNNNSGTSLALCNDRFLTKKMDKLLKRSMIALRKGQLVVGMQNNNQRHYRCQNAL